MVTTAKIWTEEELMALPKDGKYELVHGELRKMSPAFYFDHGEVIARLMFHLTTHVYAQKLGTISDGQSGCWMKSGNMRSPDISFLGKERRKALGGQAKGFLKGAPDLAVEVLSPSDTVKNIAEKLIDYFASGAKLVWVVNLEEKSVLVYHSATPDRVLKAGDRLDGGSVLPGFQLEIAELFAQPDLD
jgi:Uma2 family endonuclease